MKKIFIYIIVGTSLTSVVSCKKQEMAEENNVKVCIAFDDPDKNQKILINTTSDAAIYWTPGSQIKMMSQSDNITLMYTGASNNIANFVVAGGSMPSGDYIGFYPASAMGAYNSIVFSAPYVYMIDPNNIDNYLSDNLLMYTKTKYSHGSSDTAFFNPAMTILEIPVKTDSGTFTINNIQLNADGPSETWGQAFIKKGQLPNVIGGASNLTEIDKTNTISYGFLGQGLVVGTTPDTLKLLVWSSPYTRGLKGYIVNINNGLFTKKITKNTSFLNSKYYKLPTLTIPDSIVNNAPSVGDIHAGGLVFYIFKQGDTGYVAGETHGLVCAPNIIGPIYWSNSTTYCATSTLFGTGQSNTNNIITTIGTSAYAALACSNCTQNGYSDWYLPSLEELKILSSNIISSFPYIVPNIYQTICWTSSEKNINNKSSAYVVRIKINSSDYTFNLENKTSTNAYIIPIRKF